MKNNWDIPKRYLRLSIYRKSSPEQLLTQLTEDADVEFNTSAAVTGALNEANIIIGGLKKETMFFGDIGNTVVKGLGTGADCA